MQQANADQRPHRLPAGVAAAAVAAAALATAWIGDDAMITMRTVENLVHGDGMTWNPGLRAQTATHPLWVLLLAGARALSGELFHTAIALCTAMTAAAAFLVLRRARSQLAAVTAALLLLLSHAFVDYATCGLENALVYLLLAAFAAVWFDGAVGTPRLRRLVLLAALLALARQDLVLLVAPCVLLAMRGVRAGDWLRALLPGAALLASWYGFALFYYGTAVPTPGYGKVLGISLPLPELLVQGLYYLLDLCWRDPVTALGLLATLALAAARRQALLLAPALGIALQLLYTLRVGGDFMSGRFFTAALLLAAVTLAHGLTGRGAAVVAALALAASGLGGGPSWLHPLPSPAEARPWHGIVDERAYYAEAFSLWSPRRGWPEPGAVTAALRQGGRTRPVVDLAHTVGHRGLLAGPMVLMVEPWICDPLLVRLPVADPRYWRIGHFTRRLPEGYLESLASGEDRLRDPALREYWAVLRPILAAPLFDRARLSALWRYWWGGGDELLRRYVAESYRRPLLVQVEAGALARPVAPGQHWFDADGIVVREGGLSVRFAAPQSGARLVLWADGGGAGKVRFLRGGQELGGEAFSLSPALLQGARPVTLAVPPAAQGFDAIALQLDGPRDPTTAILELFAVLAVQVE